MEGGLEAAPPTVGSSSRFNIRKENGLVGSSLRSKGSGPGHQTGSTLPNPGRCHSSSSGPQTRPLWSQRQLPHSRGAAGLGVSRKGTKTNSRVPAG